MTSAQRRNIVQILRIAKRMSTPGVHATLKLRFKDGILINQVRISQNEDDLEATLHDLEGEEDLERILNAILT